MAGEDSQRAVSQATEGTALEAVLTDYLRALEGGRQPDEQQIVEQHPELAAELRSFFGNRKEMEQFAKPLRSPGQSRSSSLKNGKVQYLGDYELLEEIGFGGMGVIFKARQTSLQRIVAVKMILDGRLPSAEDRQRFRMEAEAAASLDHPSILPIFEVGEHEGRQYFSMKLVEGGSLSQRLSRGALPIRQATSLLITVARAVHFAHQRGILHRDLKPANILLDAVGEPYITDFGLAKRVERDSDLTHTGAVLGTPSYMAPEQAAGQSRNVTTSTDVYGLGAILYTALTGRAPFQAETVVQTLKNVLEREPDRPSSINPNVDRDLETICLKCLQKEPLRRYSSAEALARDLERYLAGGPVLARPINSWAESWRWCRRNPLVASLAALLLIALVAAASTSSLAYFNELAHGREIEGKNIEIGQALQREKESNTEESRAKDDATHRLYRSLVAQARANRLSRRVGQQFESLNVLAEASQMAHKLSLPEEDFVELRNEAIACLTLNDVRTAQQWNGWPTGSLHVDFDGTLERYARVDRAGNVSIRRVSDDAELWSLAGLGPSEAWPTLSPDGKFLAVWNDRFKLWSLAGREPVLLREGPGTAEFSLDSRRLATVRPEGLVTLFELPSGEQSKEFRIASPYRIAFHPQLPQVAISTSTGVQVLDIETGNVVAGLSQGGATNLAWHPDGKTLSVVGGDSNIYCWDVAARKVIAELKGHTEGTNFAFSHTGDTLASAGWGQPLRLWNPQTAELLFQTPMPMKVFIRFSPDDQRLAVALAGDGRLRILEVAVPQSCYRTMIRDPVLGVGRYCSSAISPNGRLLAAALDGGVAVWDLPSGKPVTFLPTGNMILTVRFEPSGALLASGQIGLVRWPIDIDAADSGTVHIGPHQKLPQGQAGCLGMSQDGRIVAQALGWGGLLWNRDSSNPPFRLLHKDARFIDVSPDGRWVATGSHGDTKVIIWDARTGTPAHELPLDGGSRVVFSSDSRRLATTFDGIRLWSVESGKEVRYIAGDGAVAFSPDDRILAVETGNGVIRLMNPDTGRDYALLEDPHQDRACHARFSADGSQLAVTATEGHAVHVWNLRAIRARLSEMRLDWHLPQYPPAAAAAVPLKMVPLPPKEA